MNNAPTPREKELLGFILKFDASKGYAPTLYEMAESLKVSRTRVSQLIEQLYEKGLVDREPGAFRTVRLTPDGQSALKRKAA